MPSSHNRIRILYVHHSTAKGGAPRSLAFLIKELDKLKFEPFVLTPGEGEVAQLFRDAGAQVLIDHRIRPFHGSIGAKVGLLRFLRQLKNSVIPTYLGTKQALNKVCPDIVHLNSATLFMSAMAVKNVSINLKVVVHIRETLLDSFFGKIHRYMNHKYSDAYIAIDSYGLSKIKSKNRIAKKIYNFVDLSEYDSQIRKDILREKAKLGSDTLVALFLARISPGNGALELVRMAKKMSMKIPKIHFFIVGFNSREINPYQEKIANEAHGNSNIHLLNFRNDVIDLIASSDVMVCPFTESHFARAIVEASAMGLPTIATNIPGPNELVIDRLTGLLYDPGDEVGFFKAFEKLCNNEELRRQYGRNAIDFAKEKFSSKKNAAETFDVYEQLLS